MFHCCFKQQPLQAQTYFLDFKFILNESDAEANKLLNNELNQGIKKLKDTEKFTKRGEKYYSTEKNIISRGI